MQGTLGVGAGTFLMLVMLASPINPRVAAATSGYQLLFSGSAALTEQFINDKISIENALFYFLWTAIPGGIATILSYRFLKKMDPDKMKKILLINILVLCIMSLILILPATVQRTID